MKLKNVSFYYSLLSFETALKRLLRMSGVMKFFRASGAGVESQEMLWQPLILRRPVRAVSKVHPERSRRHGDGVIKFFKASGVGIESQEMLWQPLILSKSVRAVSKVHPERSQRHGDGVMNFFRASGAGIESQEMLRQPLILRRPVRAVSKDRSGLKNFLYGATLVLAFFAPCLSCDASLQMTAPKNITFATSTRAPGAVTPTLYVGAAPSIFALGGAANILAYKLARITVNDFVSGVPSDNILQPFVPLQPATPLAPVPSLAPITLDGESGKDHPLKDPLSVIAQLTTFAGQFPLFALAKYSDSAAAASPTSGGIFMITDDGGGSAMVQLPMPHDHNDAAIDSPPVALAASKKFVFAAVSKAGTQFDDVLESKRGIAILQQNVAGVSEGESAPAKPATTKFTLVNPANVSSSAATPALTLDLTINSNLLSFGNGTATSISRALVGRKAAMCWDEGLQRLYVGFSDVRRDDVTKAGGVLGVCMVSPQHDTAGVLQHFATLPVLDGLSQTTFYSKLPDVLTENSNPAKPTAAAGTALPGVVNPATGANGFSVALADIKICLKILKAANEYVATHPGGAAATANALLAYLKGAGAAAANIFAAGRRADEFLSDFNANPAKVEWGALAAAQHLYIFGVDRDLGGNPAGAGTDATLRDAIRTRLVNLLNNAKIVNKAYAQANKPHGRFINSLDFIFGFFADGLTSRVDFETNIVQARNDGDDNLGVSIPRLAVMNTSTGRPYLIVHSIMSTSPSSFGATLLTEADNWVYALPLVPTAINGMESLKGTIAQVTNDEVGKIDLLAVGEYQFPQDHTGMPKRFHTAARVGGGNPIPASWVQDMFVVGDSVYITLAGPQAGQQGVFKSTAIFDDKGIITSWTPATRVMGSVLQTFASMLDEKSGNFYSLTQTPTAGVGNRGATTAQVTQWGRGAARMHGGASDFALDAVLGKLFDSKKGGVHGVVAFDELTYGFPKKQVSMLMAYGFDGVALVQTGKRDGRSFVPITKNTTTAVPAVPGVSEEVAKNVWYFNDPALSALGPFTCGAVVHNPPAAAGHGFTKLYVGGYRGLAVLEVAFPVVGVTAIPDNAAFMVNLKGIRNFVPDGRFAGQSVVAVGQAITRDPANNTINHRYLHVVTQDQVSIEEIPVPGGGLVGLIGAVGVSGASDGVVLADGALVADSSGLKLIPPLGVNSIQLAQANEVGQILQLELLASRDVDGLFCLPATAYLLTLGNRMPLDTVPDPSVPVAATDPQDLVPQIWRIGISKNDAGVWMGNVIDKYTTNPAMKTKSRPYVQYPDLRLNFNVDGSIWFDVSSKDGVNSDFIRIGSLGKPLDDLSAFVTLQTSLTDVMNIDRLGNFRIGVPRREPASGAWLVPGDWGVIVNE